MDKIAEYKIFIKTVLSRHLGNDTPNLTEYEDRVIADDEHGYYVLLGTGWRDLKRIHGISAHIELKGDKIWVHQDWTEPGVVEELEELGVPQSDIVLAFQAPYRRKMMPEYAQN
jgi:hypothetical protein